MVRGHSTGTVTVECPDGVRARARRPHLALVAGVSYQGHGRGAGTRPIICFYVACPSFRFTADPGPLGALRCVDVRALMRLLPILAILAGLTATAAAENWPQWRGPGGQGVSTDTQAPTEWAPDKNVVWKAELPGTGMSSPIVWGDRIYLTAVIEGDVVPGQRAVKHRQGQEQDWIHPDSVAADKKHTFKVARARRLVRQDPLGSDGLRRHGLRRAPSAQQLRRADAGDRRRDGLRLLRSRRPLRL